jgi:hypothetical protein
MPDISKGGRGKRAPYTTTHYRIPEPIKPTVEQLADAYRLLVDEASFDRDGSQLLSNVQTAIANSTYPEDKPGTTNSESIKPGTNNKQLPDPADLLNQVKGKLKGKTKVTLRDVEAILELLEE